MKKIKTVLLFCIIIFVLACNHTDERYIGNWKLCELKTFMFGDWRDDNNWRNSIASVKKVENVDDCYSFDFDEATFHWKYINNNGKGLISTTGGSILTLENDSLILRIENSSSIMLFKFIKIP